MRSVVTLSLCSILIVLAACTAPQPTPLPTPDVPATVTAQVQAQLASLPTVTPLPTSTPYPTATAYPTPTGLPTATPYPTATPRPTYTPYPTVTPIPTPTSTPTPVPTATPTLTPTPLPTATLTPRPTATSTPPPTPTPTRAAEWVSSGSWYRDFAWEATIRDIFGGEGDDQRYKIATLDADPEMLAQIALALGCIDRLPVAYLAPYSGQVPSGVDTYVVGIWDVAASDWHDSHHYSYDDPFITLDRGAIYIYNRAQVTQVLRALRFADNQSPSRLALNTGMYDLSDEGWPGIWGEYDVTGLEDALAYLECFRGMG